jgi:GNAT superfamily N-acetyltransferase
MDRTLTRVPVDVARASLLPPPVGPAQPRFDACWADTWPGTWYLDRTDRPTLLVLVDPVATITWSGTADPHQIQTVVDATVDERGEAMIGLHHGDPRTTSVPATWTYHGTVLDHLGRTPASAQPPILDPGSQLVDLDQIGWEHTYHASWATGIAQHGAVAPIGVGLTVGDGTLVAEAVAIPCTMTVAEIAVWVAPDHRRRGLGTWIAGVAVEHAEHRGFTPYWNTNAENTASITIATRLGFHTPVTYELWAWP